MLHNRRRLFKLIALGWLVSLIVALSLTPQARTATHTLMLVPQLLPTLPVKPQQWFVAEPAKRSVAYTRDDGVEETADVYAPPGGGKHGGVLLFLGVNPAGKDDERVVNLANGLARAGIGGDDSLVGQDDPKARVGGRGGEPGGGVPLHEDAGRGGPGQAGHGRGSAWARLWRPWRPRTRA